MMTDANGLFSVQGLVTLVSGGSRGIGKAIAKGFVQHGATVIVSSRDRETLERTADEISTVDNPVTPIVGDVSKQQDNETLVGEVIDRFGRIDVFQNVAGVNMRMPMEDYTPEEFDRIHNINQRGVYFLAVAVAKQMFGQGGGVIVNVDSLNTYAPIKRVAPYAMTKAAVLSMTRSMAMEWADKGVRVNTIAPGFILTDLSRKLWSRPNMRAWAETNTPQGRLGEVDDLVGTAIFLSSRASAFMTGQVLRVDGGFTAGVMWPIDDQ